MPKELTDEYYKELRLAIMRNQADKVEALLEDADIDAISHYQQRNGKTLLLEAVERGHEETIDVLLKKGIDPNVASRDGSKPLGSYLGIIYDQENGIVKENQINQKLLEAGAIDETGEYTKSPLVLAVDAKDIETVKSLIAQGVDVNEDNKEGQPLWEKARNNPEMFEVLCQAGMNLETQDELGHTALMSAIYSSNDQIMQICLDNNADVNAKSNSDIAKGMTPLHMVDNPEIMQQLIDRGADVNACDATGATPIVGKSAACMEVLYNAGADMNVVINGQTLMTKAAIRQDVEAMEFLQDKGFDINATDENGWTPLKYCAADKRQVCIPDEQGKFVIKTSEADKDVVRQVIEMGAHVRGTGAMELCTDEEILALLRETEVREKAELKQDLRTQRVVSDKLEEKKVAEARDYQQPTEVVSKTADKTFSMVSSYTMDGR